MELFVVFGIGFAFWIFYVRDTKKVIPTHQPDLTSKQSSEARMLHLAGTPHSIGKKTKPSSILREGQELIATREPSNPHDRNAIALFASGCKVGYVPRTDNQSFARHMDKGGNLRVVITFINDRDPWNGITIKVTPT